MFSLIAFCVASNEITLYMTKHAQNKVYTSVNAKKSKFTGSRTCVAQSQIPLLSTELLRTDVIRVESKGYRFTTMHFLNKTQLPEQ